MRVVAGAAGGRPLKAPAGRATRPTSDRVREAMFDMLTSLHAVDGTEVVDLFAGSGALGIEALSRGASRVTFVERDPGAVTTVRANLAAVADLAGCTEVVRGDAVGWARRRTAGEEGSELVLADPPYAWAGWGELLDALAPTTALLVAETGGPWQPGDGWESVRARRYGSTVVTIVRPRARGGS